MLRVQLLDLASLGLPHAPPPGLDRQPLVGEFVQGGAVQGIGWALNEEYLYDDDGVLENPGFLDYRIPVASDLPFIDTVIVEVANPLHPFGVKGVGEVPIVPPMPAIAEAVYQSTGVRFRDLPLNPPKIVAGLAGN